MDIIIRNGTVYDGSGNDPVKGDVGIRHGKILYPLEQGTVIRADTVIQGEGLAVAPGFINIHGHSDTSSLIDNRMPSVLLQGITTEVAGNCGHSMAPLEGEELEECRKYLKTDYDIELDWKNMAEFLKRIEDSRPVVNFITLAGHGTLRGSFVGLEDRSSTAGELAKMKAELAKALEQGAWGYSTGLIYPPCVYAHTDEIAETAKAMKSLGGFYSSHIRGEGDTLFEAIEEALEIGQRAECRVEISHLKAAGERNWGKTGRVLEMIREARNSGLFVQHDQYPYTASATGLGMMIPDWVHNGGNDAMVGRLKDPETRTRIAEEMKGEGFSNYDRVIISDVNKDANKKYEGRKISEIAEQEGRKPQDVIIDILIDEDGGVGAIYLSMCEEDVRRVMADPFTAVCTDASARALDGPLFSGKPHPRSYGSFPRVLAHYCRELKLFSMAEAIRKMTSLPANMLGLSDRGLIRNGFHGDIVIFDPEKIRDRATYENPHLYPEGIEYILVNGRIVARDNDILTPRPGLVLRNQISASVKG